MELPILFWIYLILNLIMGIINIIMYGKDKIEAVGNTRNRTPVYVLITLPALGGAWGAFIGMIFYRHKSLKSYFRFANLCALLIHIIVFVTILVVGG